MAPPRSAPDESTSSITVSPNHRAKRSRISRACDQCRSEKERCDGDRPQCSSCVSARRPCTYEQEVKKRGPRMGYVRALECTLAWIFDVVPCAEERVARMTTVEGLELLGSGSAEGDSLHRKWTRCRVNRRIQMLLGAAHDPRASLATVVRGEGDSDEEVGEAEDDVIWEVQRRRAEDCLSSATTNARPLRAALEPWPPPGTQSTAFISCLPRHVDGVIPLAVPPDQTRAPQLPPNYRHLLDIYIAYTHSWLPILSHIQLLNTAARYGEHGLGAVDTTSGHVAELWACLAVGAFQYAHATSTIDPSQPLVQLSPRKIYDTARGFVPSSEDATFDIGHVCAILLLATIKIGEGRNNAAYLLVGTAVRLALNLELGRMEITGRDSPELSRHAYVFSACFVLDTLVAAVLGQPRHLRSSNINPDLPVLEFAPEEHRPWIPCSGIGTPCSSNNDAPFPPTKAFSSFAQIYRFVRILNDSLDDHPTDHRTSAIRSLIQSLDPAFAYCNSVVPVVAVPVDNGFNRNGETPSVPSSFVVHTTFLVTAMVINLRAGQRTSQVWTLLELIESHISQFGLSGMPPILIAYMSLIGGRGGIFDRTLGGDSLPKVRWESIAEALRRVWTGNEEQQSTLHLGQELSPISGPLTSTTAHSAPSRTMEVGHPYGQPRTAPGQSCNEATFSLVSASSSSNLASGPSYNTSGMTGLYPSPSPTVQASLSTHIKGPAAPMASAHVVTDFDAALAEIAEIDPFDDLDAEREFLVNLGFAPGVNMNELLGMDFRSA